MAPESLSTRERRTESCVSYLDGAVPCQFPSMGAGEMHLTTTNVNFIDSGHRYLLVKDSKMALIPVALAWALTLRTYTGQDDITFACGDTSTIAEGKDVPVQRILFKEEIRIGEITSQLQNSGDFGSQRLSSQSLSELCNTALISVTTPDSHTAREVTENFSNKFALCLQLHICNDEARLSLFHRNSLEQGLNIAGTLSKALDEVFNRPDAMVKDVNCLSVRDMKHINTWNKETLEFEDRCIHDLIHQQAMSKPYAEAVCDEHGSLSYRDLDQITSRLASHLISLGLRPGVFVPLCFEKEIWNVVAMLAVMKSGAAFVPLDPDAPIARLQSLAEDVAATIILCSQRYAGMLLPAVEHVLPVDGEMIGQLPKSNLAHRSTKPSDLAYVIYTSGTTGVPKGTMIEHRAYCSGAKAHAPAMLIDAHSRSLQFAAHTFDASLVEILTTLMVGGVVCIPSNDQRLNNLALAMRQMRVNWAVLTPSFVGFIDPAEVPDLKTLTLAGEAMSEAHIAKWSHINLVNGYGPSECSVAAVVNSKVTPGTSPMHIGRATGAHLWVVHPSDHNILVPVGCTGELLIQGPTLARGYHGKPDKTIESFITATNWAPHRNSNLHGWRLYKTGDLVRQCPDGTLMFVGRKDTQVKVHGQRVELGEVEHHLNTDCDIKHSLVLLPKDGHFKGRLVTIISFLASDDSGKDQNPLRIIEDDRTETIRERLSSEIPSHMVPSIWIVVESIPSLPSGKLDRRKTTTWIEGMDESSYRRVVRIAQSNSNARRPSLEASTEMESKLRQIWSHVLNLEVEQIGLDSAFISLGGDSISALQVKGQCGKKGISLGVQEILRSKGVKQLAQLAKVADNALHHEIMLNHNFDLSPIQKLFFELPNQGQGHFNQSFFLRISQEISAQDLNKAIESIIQRHSMLRARFVHTSGGWQQYITDNISSSYRLKTHEVENSTAATSAISDSQSSLSHTAGPLFAVDLFNIEGGEQLLFMVGHHLVIDLVSWRVILEDLEELLTAPTSLSVQEPMSFQTWCYLQAEHCQKVAVNKVLPLRDVPPGDAEYWGMNERANTYGGVVREGFEVDSTITSALLTGCHNTFRTETIDLLLSALIHSFSCTFEDRSLPAIYNEGHGRETSGMAADLSRTVGWFTIMYPVHVTSKASKDLVSTIKEVKDLRRRIPDNGRPYFASRCLTEAGRSKFGTGPLEITFNYLGLYQQLERKGALLTPVDDLAGEAKGAGGTADVGFDTPRFGLFEISAVIVQGKLRFSFTFNRDMRNRGKISQWISLCQNTMGVMVETLSTMNPQATPGDFPLLSLTSDGFKSIVDDSLPLISLSIDDVEDIYPCSSMQEGLLISQTKSSAFYAVQVIYELKAQSGVRPSSKRLESAIQKVIARHPLLRTIFIDSVSKDDGLYDQVVLKCCSSKIVKMDAPSAEHALSTLAVKNPASYENNQPPYQFTVCETLEGRLFCKLDISHTIMDGNSMSVIFRDIANAYQDLLPEGPGPSYSSYISYLQNQPGDLSLEYWKSYLSNVECCTFPVLNDGQIVEKELHTLRLDFKSAQFSELQNFCDTNGVTFSNVLHTAWALTLRIFSDCEDICFGYLTSGRDAPVEGIEDAVGPFINMLVCRISMAPASRLGAVLDQIQKDYIDSLPHRDTSLAEVQHALKLSGTALFNTALSYRRLPSSMQKVDSHMHFEECMPIYDPTEYDISINVEASEHNAVIDLDFWTNYISDGQASHIGNTFLHCLENILHHCDETIESLNYFCNENSIQVLKWNAQMPPSVHNCVYKVIESQAELQPDAPAVCGWDRNLTYSELDQITSRLASLLSNIGVGPETFVPTCFDKSSYTIIAMLSVLKAGAAAVPLDANHPRSALELRVRDTNAKVVLTSPSRAELFVDMNVHVIPVCEELLNQLPHQQTWSSSNVTPQNPAFVIFTSGSTGTPKGVVLENEAICSSALATGSAYNWGPGSRVLQFASYTFDNSLAEIFIALMRGACVCVPSEHDRFNNLAGAINDLNVNFIDITPTVASFLRPSDVPKVKGLSLGGEPLTKDNIEVWGNAVALHCCYGPSECSINSVWNGNLQRSSEATNIGKSIGSVSWVVDPSNHDRLMPIGCVGELLIEGPILARGYLNDPEKTSKAFIYDPAWITGHGRRMYKTGDLVRYNSDGTITYMGRKDSQVKLHGQRLELGEIEHHVKRILPANIQSAVELTLISGATKALAVFVCDESVENTEDGQNNIFLPISDSLRTMFTALETALSNSLPSFMVPSIYLPITSMPMTSSGKLDRRSLRTSCNRLTGERITEFKLARRTSRPPSTEMEKLLAQLWESVLNLDFSVGADDNFFKCTGDSITAMKLITAARNKGVVFTVADIFRKPTLSELASTAALLSTSDTFMSPSKIEPFSLISSDRRISDLIANVASLCRIRSDAIQDIYPCTSLQQGFIALSSKDAGAYVAQNLYQLPASIDLDRFRAAWQTVVEAEMILRTRIVYLESLGFLQVVVREPITWYEYSNLSALTEQDRQLPSYNGGPLSRYAIVESAGAAPHFVWTAHHAIYDGWCIPLLLERVEACYHKIDSVDTTIGAGYPRFIKYLTQINAAESDEFWKHRLSEPTSAQFPALPNPTYQAHVGSSSTYTAAITRIDGSHITLPSIIRASWAMVVATYSGSPEDVVFGETLTGRDAPVYDLDKIIGPTLATVPTRVRIDKHCKVGKFLEDLQTQSAEAIPYQYSGLQHIKHLSEDTSVACGFQNLLAIHHNDDELNGGFWNLKSSGTTGTNFYSYPLTVSCQIAGGKVEIDAHYDKDTISIWLVDNMLRQFGHILDLFNRPDIRGYEIGQLPLLNPKDEEAILRWNNAPLKAANECIHYVIGKQVLQQPESKIAVDSRTVQFSYRELDRLSTRLARHLVKQGLEGTLIPLCLDKSAFFVCAMLAILKAGAAFVPLDPAAPLARLRDIITDTDAKTICCSPRLQKLCAQLVPTTIALDLEMMESLADEKVPLPTTNSGTTAYIIYTSGSTGKPKGTVISHGAFCASAAEHGPGLSMNSDSRVLQFASYTFDASLLETLTALTLGACVCVPEEESRLNGIAEFMNEKRVNWAFFTPSFIQTMRPSQVPTLKHLVLGGEALSQTIYATWADQLELINAYGPTECAVIATANPRVTPSTDPNDLGKTVGGCAWITDRANPDRLAPIGSAGELIIEGPVLANGYLNNKSKTDEVFIEAPKWASRQSQGTVQRRMYRTGDLVKYSPNGNIIFCGRIDTQRKVRGQRLELGEVETHLRTDPRIQHVLVTIPKAGFCKDRLISVLSLQELVASSDAQGLSLVVPEASSFYVTAIRERLCELLPGYMIPSNWIIVRSLPLLPSGKLDRKKIERWTDEMNLEVYQQISEAANEEQIETENPVEQKLQAIWGAALNLPPAKIGLHQNFLSMGGDSISAMAVFSSCKMQGLGVTVQDIIQSKSISQLATKVTLPEAENSHEEEELDKHFDLSPIQKLYFECVGDQYSHFNQSVVVRLTRRVTANKLTLAVESLMHSHSMLRARFEKNKTGEWKQKIPSNVSGSYHCSTTSISLEEIESLVGKRQKSLNIQTGPTFAVDLIEIAEEDYQILSLVAHHLVIDVVSWRIILQDLEDVLNSGALKLQSSLPFQTWLQHQKQHTLQKVTRPLPSFGEIPSPDFGYWGMLDKPNNYGETLEDEFVISQDTTLRLLGSCHGTLQTEPIDVFLGAVLQSFQRVFSDRSQSTIYNEGHGREPWDGSRLDLSRTVGWFTTMCPIFLPSNLECETDLLNTIRWTKDLRSRIPGKGRPYFARRLLTEEGAERFSNHWPMEVAFNYLGIMQQLERKDTLFQTIKDIKNYDIGTNVPRFALFEISIAVENSSLKVSFSYNRHMKRQAKIRRWVTECQRSLEEAATLLLQTRAEPTLSSFPLVPLTYNGISRLMSRLPQLGIASIDEVEDVYPCSPTQQGMLLAQVKNADLYSYSANFQVRASTTDTRVDIRLLAEAWQAVVRRHASLRTIFIDSLRQDGMSDQVVLKDFIARISWLECEDSQALATLQKQKPLNFRDFQPPHRFTLCKTTGSRVFCKLELSHSICDGTSIPILLRDLSIAYTDAKSREVAGFLSTKEGSKHHKSDYSAIGPLYSDYIAYIQSKPGDDIRYWKDYLSGVEPCLITSLNDGHREEKRLQSLVLTLSQASALRTFCSENALTLSNVLQLSWAIILRLYTGSDEVCFGYLTSGRDAPVRGIQDAAVGAFINMLTCKVSLDGSVKLDQALAKMQTDFVEGMVHQSCSLADVQHELGLAGTSLFNTAFTFQKRSSQTSDSQSTLLFDVADTEDPSEYDITVNVEAYDSKIDIHFGYWSTTLSRGQAANLSETFDYVVNTIIKQKPQQTIAELDFLSEASRKQITAWNLTLPPTVDRCIHDMVQQWSLGDSASKPAIHAWDLQLSFAEMDEMANRLAIHLISLGIGPESFVPLCFEKTGWAIVAMMGVMKAGGAFVPLDHTHPENRLQQFVEDVDANLVLCSRQSYAKIASIVKVAFVVDSATVKPLRKTLSVLPLVSPGNVAYSIFTSGTTGRPKGTIIEHGAFCTSAVEHAKAMYMRHDSRVFQFASYTFDASVMEILTTLITGGCVCIPSDDDRMNDIPGAIKRMGVTWTLLTPSVASTLSPKSVPSLKVLVTGGEAMKTGHIDKWKGQVAIINAYGPSETSVIASTSTKVDENGNEINTDPSNIGQAVGGRTWIVDPRDYNKLMPVGAIGELAVEGRTVARGYLKNPEKTAQAFVNNPIWLRDLQHKERVYRTGDLVRYNSDGSLAFVARKDTQIKLNGQRIELGEIEHNVKDHLPDSYQSAVELVAPMSNRSTKALAAFFCSPVNNSNPLSEDRRVSDIDAILLSMSEKTRAVAKSLDSSLATVLPTYMIPSFYIPITKMPWTSSGKLDRQRLRNIVQSLPKELTGPYRLASSEAPTNQLPTSPIEQRLQRLWESILNLPNSDSVSSDDNFFRLGGDSVASMKLVGAAKAEGISLSVMDIFRNPRLCDMASICTVLEDGSSTDLAPFSLLREGEYLEVVDELSEQCQVQKETIQDAYPCSLLQQGLVTLSMKQPGAYVAQNVFLLPRDLDIARFKRAWQTAMEEVDILRTRVVHMKSSAFLQVVLRAEPIAWHNTSNLQSVTDEPAQLPLHNGGPLTQFTIVTDTASDDRYFVWSIHHALYDGWSLPMILQRVESVYIDEGSARSQSSYASFIKYLSDTDVNVSDEFWKQRLSGASPLQFPQSQKLTASGAADLESKTFTHTVPVSSYTSSIGITIPSIIRAAWSLVLASYSGSNDVVFGETLAGRDIAVAGITEIIGPTFTTVPTRIEVDRETKILSFLQGIQRLATEVIPYQHAGLQRIKRLNSDAELACDFQNLLVIQTADEDIENDMWDIQGNGVASNFFTYPLVLECKGNSKKVEIIAHYNESILSTWETQRIVYQLDTVLQQLSDIRKFEGDSVLDQVQVFGPQDQELVQSWNSKEPSFVDACIHAEFEKVVAIQPDQLAITAHDGEFTYAELQSAASKLGQHLILQGVGPETFVPICMDKSKWAVVAMLGIMYAGGAYVPLDPAAPLTRHIEMMEDVQATMVVCSPQYANRYSNEVTKTISVTQEMLSKIRSESKTSQDLQRVTSDNSCYAIFTSGSTGRPKGTVVQHRAISTSSAAMRRTLLMDPSARIFQFASFTFDVSVLEIFTTLTNGGCICIPSEEQRVGDVTAAINSLQATWAFLTPSVANLIDPVNVPSLEVLVCGGEAMSTENVLKWASKVTLVNGYGPTEASVIAVANPDVSKERNPSVIGRALPSGRAWIADPQNHNHLAPVGCVGELLLDGPLLAKGYINNPTKTDEVFVERPSWATSFEQVNSTASTLHSQQPQFGAIYRSSPSRMYKTGDLVKYRHDGSLIFIGRKDHQVKLHGQRMEPGEIEHALDQDSRVQHALVSLPKSGPFKNRLIAVLTLAELATTEITKETCNLVLEGPQAGISRKQISAIRQRLGGILPSYMIPSSWLVVESIPLLPSGKLDRRNVERWLSGLEEQIFEKIMSAEEEEDDDTAPVTDAAQILQRTVSRVLNLPIERVKPTKSFVALGGDSIAGMQLMALCRKEKMNFTLSEVLKSKSLNQLASNAHYEDAVQHQAETYDVDFRLSPIQQLYFQSQTAGYYENEARFNQSFSLEITRPQEADAISRAIDTIVREHSMLRARFSKDASAEWYQRLTKDTTSSYTFLLHEVDDADQIPHIVASSQSSLNIRNGPLFVVDLINVAADKQMIFLAAHHLIIDMVSWRIILQDLEEILSAGSISSEKPMSFQRWCGLQEEHSRRPATQNQIRTLPFTPAPADVAYWGMSEGSNTYGDVVSQSFTVNETLTSLALDKSNKALRTEALDLFLSAIVHSFARVFVDRGIPSVHNESHGREPWNSSINLSRTVGWFTTIAPVHVDVDMDEDDVVETVRRMKDNRRKLIDNGRPYFAHQFLSKDEAYTPNSGDDGTTEIIFNYLGRMQQLEHDDSLLQQWEYPETEEISKLIADVGPKATRMALFEISAAVIRGEIQFSFLFNSRMQHQRQIRRWVSECQATFEEIIERLAASNGVLAFTLSDFPLLPISYDGLKKIVTKSLPQVGIEQDEVEEIYPCAPLQEGLLISQLKNPSLYHFHAVFEAHPPQGKGPVDTQQLAKSWQRVVDYHGALRTVFSDSVYKGDIFNQIIVKEVDSGVILVECDGGEEEALEKLKNHTILDNNYKKQPRLPHQGVICRTSSGKVFFKAEINHVVIDGASANIMLRDLAAAYHGTLPEGAGPSYSNYVAYIKSHPIEESINYWRSYLEGAKACYFPTLQPVIPKERRIGSVQMKFGKFAQLQDMCKKMNVTFANLMQVAWGFCLRHHTKTDDICFGYLTSGRDMPVDQIQDTMGAFINMLVCRIRFDKQLTLKEVFQKVQNSYLESLDHQHCSLAQVQHELLAGENLFNTAVSIQSDSAQDHVEDGSIWFEPVAAHDPSEYAVTVNIRTMLGDEGIVLRYWNTTISDDQADELVDMMARVLDQFVSKPFQLVEDLSVSTDVDTSSSKPPEERTIPAQPQHFSSEAQLRTIVSECVREVLEQLFKSGTLVSYDPLKLHNTINTTSQQVVAPMIDYSQVRGPPIIEEIEKPEKLEKPFMPESKSFSKRGAIEQKLLAVWSDLLQISADSIENEANFFELGGDSIVAMQMVGAAREEDLALTVANIFRNPKFADMAAAIRTSSDSERTEVPAIEYRETREPKSQDARSRAIQNAMYQRYSLLEAANVDAFLQENICSKVRAFRGGIVDVFPVTDFQSLAVTGSLMESKWMLNYFFLEGRGSIDLKRLKSAIGRIVESFDILRTVFVPYGNKFFQVVLRKLQPSFLVHETDDLADFTVKLQKNDRQNATRLGESFLQFTIAREKGTQQHRIIMRMSHAQYDGVCLPRILAALQMAYQGRDIAPTPPFSGYVRDAARTMTDDHYMYWKGLLKGSSMTELVQRHGPNYSRGTEAPTTLKRVVQIPSLAHESITPATTIKAAWSLVLAQISASSDIVFGNVISGRNAAVVGVESMIGPCVNMIPIRVPFQSNWSVLDLLKYVQGQQIANMPYESLGFREIIKHCTDWPDWTNFSTVCQHQNIEKQAKMQLGANQYTLGAVGSQEDFADITILSTPQEGEGIEICLIFTENSGITLPFAESLFEDLCDTIASFSADLKAALPTPEKLCSFENRTLKQNMPKRLSDLNKHLKGLSKEELASYSTSLRRAWGEILRDVNSESSLQPIMPSSSFYGLGGDIIGISQVAGLLENEDLKIRVEDLVDHPLFTDQLALVALAAKAKKERDDDDMRPNQTSIQESPKEKGGIKKVLGGLAKKIKPKRTINERPENIEA